MKVNQKQNTFQPVTLTLETEAEVRLIAALLGATDGTIIRVATGESNVALYETWKELCKIAKPKNKLHIITHE